MKNIKTLATSLILVLPLVLSACGGSSAPLRPKTVAPPPPPPPPPPPDPETFKTPEYLENWGLDAINPTTAYAAGATGKGVIVAVIDTGIDEDHIDLIGNIHPASKDMIESRDPQTVNDTDGHGTFIAGVIAAPKNNIGAHGVAYKAQILALRADDTDTCADEVDGCSFLDSDIAAGILFAIETGAKVINLSLGGEDPATPGLINAIRQATDAGILVVVAAGNESLPDPSVFAQIANDPQMSGGVIVVGAIDDTKTIADFSNMAGNTQNYYVVAPGVDVTSLYPDDMSAIGGGTSFAAPHVSGAGAILFELFPNLSGADIVQLLLTTSTDLGDPDVDAVYGYGLINLEEAIKPQGATAAATEIEGITTLLPVVDMSLVSSPAFGDAFAEGTQSGGLGAFMMLDSYNRSYSMSLADVTRMSEAPGLNMLGSLMAREAHKRIDLPLAPFGRAGHVGFSFYDPNSSLRDLSIWLPSHMTMTQTTAQPNISISAALSDRTDAHMGIGYSIESLMNERRGAFLTQAQSASSLTGVDGDSLSIAIRHTASKQGQWNIGFSQMTYKTGLSEVGRINGQTPKAIMTRLGYKHSFGTLDLMANMGAMVEENALLGSRSYGAAKLASSATSMMVNLAGQTTFSNGISLDVNLTAMETRTKGGAYGLIKNIGRLRSTSWSASLLKNSVFKSHDRLGLSLSQPLRVEQGQAYMRTATGRDYATDSLLFEDQSINLSPSGRQINVEMSYNRPLGKTWMIEANLVHQKNPAHSVFLTSNTALLLNFSKHLGGTQ